MPFNYWEVDVLKKHVLSRRVLSVVLSAIMILCSLPVVVFAAEKAVPEILEWPTGTLEYGQGYKDAVLSGGSASVPGTFSLDLTQSGSPNRPGRTFNRIGIFTPDDTENYETVKLQSAIAVTILPSKHVETIGAPIATEIKRGDSLEKSSIQTGTLIATSFGTRLDIISIEWKNPDEIMNEVGTISKEATVTFNDYAGTPYAEPITVSVPVTVVSSELVAEVEELPTIPTVTYREGLKIGDLKLVGGKANTEGTFTFAQPDRALSAGQSIPVEVVFTPADTNMKAVSVTVNVTVEKGDIQVLQTPTLTIGYGTKLKNVSLSDFKELETIPASGVSWDWAGDTGTGLSDPRADQILAVGTYNDILVRANTFNNANYALTYIPIKVVVNPVATAFPMLCEIDAAARQITVTGRGNPDAKGTVTYTLHSDGLAEDLVIEGKGVQDVATFQLDENAKSGAYTVTAAYHPAGANDPCNYASATKDLDVRLSHSVTVIGGRAMNGDAYQAGDTVYIRLDLELIKKNYEFKSWKITNANGDTIDVGVEDLTAKELSFVMPDEAVKVEAQTSFSIQLFFENLGNSILSFFMKVVEWIQGLFNGLGSIT